MKDVTGRLARASSLHPWRTLALWGGVLVLSVAAIGGLLGSALTTDAEMTNDPESYRAYDLLREHFPPTDDYVNELVVIRSKTVDFDSPAFRARVERLAANLEATGVVQPVRTYYSTGERLLVAPSRRALVVPVGLRGDGEEGIDEVIDVVDAAETDGFETAVTGEFTADRDFTTLSEEDLQKGELQFGLPAALIVLLLVFGAVVAGLVPVLVALVAIIVSLGLTALLGQAFDLSVFVVNMISGMGLALGIDYSLFVVSRYREERRLGNEKLLAIARVGSTTSRAVLFSGSAFVLAMVGMVLVPDTILRSLAAGAILVGIVTVLAALTLLPAVLALIGDRVNALRVPWLGRRVEQSAGVEGRVWSRIVRSVTRTPVLAAVLSAGLLVLAALPVLRMETGLTGVRELPDRFAAKQGFTLLEEEFGVGTADSVQVVVEGDIGAARVEQAIAELARRVGADGAFLPADVSTSPDGRLANVEALVAGDSRDERALEAVQRLRSEVVPQVFAGVDAEVLVSGETAEVVDYRELTDTWLPIVFAFVLALSFVLLTIAFRAVVLPAVAIALNLLSVGAAYGLIVLVFLEGVGRDLLGFTEVDVIAAWLPLFLFAVLFGLSMDYTVFLLSRIREHVAGGQSTVEAVAYGVASTARIITGAALIIIAVFIGFAAGDQVEFQQMGFGIAVSLLIDATVVRLVLLPAVLAILGERTWYLPRWLGWLPHLEIEGAGASPSARP
ncbi:MAG TPA: MMPL family transporter [Gaiella sp.]|uniref:MMPL family transporter n=1 Tax=Gaiella sp. TaxID=2663207 RepID=UPI002D7F3DFB|nr:MMPL family transporter [Gaiella sp.]HET9287104.1 MMPL family transporter [Gaiella sp.]